MWSVIGDLLPQTVGVAISPVPIIATILMLLAPKAGATSVGFLLGWVVGIVVATAVFTVIAATAGLDQSGGPSPAVSWVKVVLGALLLLLAWRQWHGRPRAGEPAELPKWMSAIDSFNFVKATGLGFALAGLNAKNLLMCAAAGAGIGSARLTGADTAVAVAVFTVIAASTVLIPVVGYAVAKERMRHPLDGIGGL